MIERLGESERSARVLVKVAAQAQKGMLKAKITFHTNDKLQPRIHLWVHARVR